MIIVLVIFAITYILIASEKIDKTLAALLGASAVIFSGKVPYDFLLTKVDVNVLFLLLGMMMMVGVLSVTGVFEWMAITLAQKAKGNGIRIALFFLFVTALLSSFLNNVTVIILMAPITILICQILHIPATPLLILEAIFSNIGGTGTLVGDPPNMLIASQSGLNFNQFLFNLGPVIVVVTLVSLIAVGLIFRKQFEVSTKLRSEVMRAKPELTIMEPIILRNSLIVFGLVILGFFFGPMLRLDPGFVALFGATLMMLVTKMSMEKVLKMVDWNAILFFIALFMLIGALEYMHVFEMLGEHLMAITGGNLWYTALAILWGSAILSAVVDNIPLVIAMIPLIKIVAPVYATQMGISHDPALVNSLVRDPLYWSLALGACLGGNGTLIGASANIIAAQVAHKNNYKLTFWDFTKYGFPMMILSLLICTVYIYFKYFS